MHRKNLGANELKPVAKDVAALISGHFGGDSDGRGWDPQPSYQALERALVAARHRGKRQRILAGLACGAVLVGAGFGVRSLVDRGPEGLSYTVNARAPGPGESAPRPATPQAQFSFSDGTRIELAAGARGRVADLNRRGAHFVLDNGKAHVHVVHRPGAEWSFEAGPFAVEVHGTAFSLEWNADRAWLDMKMESGVVSVRGPLAGGRVVLHAGQSLSVGLAQAQAQEQEQEEKPEPQQEGERERQREGEGERQREGDSSHPAAATPPIAAPAPAPAARPVEHRAAQTTAARPRSAAVVTPSSWSRDLDEDRAGVIVADAERRGLDRVLRESGSEELSALADAARYKRRYALARQALLAQMRRFPSSSRARDASFFLGRLCEDAEDGQLEALAFYDRYLHETPNGTYASEALGRKLMVLERSHRENDARASAADYLRRYPRGTYAHPARALLRVP